MRWSLDARSQSTARLLLDAADVSMIERFAYERERWGGDARFVRIENSGGGGYGSGGRRRRQQQGW